MKNKVLLHLLIVFMIVSASSCKQNNETTLIGTMKGPTGMGISKLLSDGKYSYELYSSPEEISADILSGKLDIACVPANLASVLYNKTEGKIKIGAINTLGVLYVVEKGDSINSFSDLNGKNILSFGQGSSPEYILKYLCEYNSIDCNVEFSNDGSEIITKLISGIVDIALIPEPYVTTLLSKDENCRIAIDLNKEFEKTGNGVLIQGVLIFSEKYLKNNKKNISAFLTEYSDSVNYVNSNIDEASAIISELGIIPSPQIAKKAIPNCNIVCITGDTMQSNLEDYFELLYQFNPKSIGGKMPDEEIYYK